MLLRFDPFRDLDQLTQEAPGMGPVGARPFPMDAYRRGDEVQVHFDLPGVQKDTIDISVERNVLTLRADRRFELKEGDELLVRERPQGTFTRQVFLGDTLDPENIRAEYADGVLSLIIPVAEQAKPRRVQVTGTGQRSTIEGTTSPGPGAGS